MLTATRAEVVDASAAIRFALGCAPELRPVFDRAAVFAPDIFALECANGVRGYVRAREIQPAKGAELLSLMLSLRIVLIPAADLAQAAYAAALELGLSAYEAAYVVVARSAEATLITADRRLAAAYDRSELIA